MYLLDEVLRYAIKDTAFIYGETAFTCSMIDLNLTTCVSITEPKNSNPAPMQIDAEEHKYEIKVRADTVANSFNNASDIYKRFMSETGIIDVRNDLYFCIEALTYPIQDTTPDQQNRKTHVFTVLMITKRTL